MSNGLGFSKVQIRANLWVSKVRPRNLRASCEDFIDHLRFLYDVWYLTCWLRRWDCAWADGKMLLKSFACDVQTQRYVDFNEVEAALLQQKCLQSNQAPKCNPFQTILKRRHPAFDHWMVFTRLLFDGTLIYCVPWCTMLEAGTSCVADSGFLFRRLRPEKFWFVDVRGKKNNGPSNRKSETVNPGRQPNL